MRRILGTFFVALALVALGSTAQAAITITNESGTAMYTDFGNGMDATYLVFQITNTGPSALSDVWVQLVPSGGIITNVGTGVHELKYKPGANGADPDPESGLAVGQTKGVFFLVKATGLTSTPQNLTVNVYSDNLITLIGTATFGFTVEDTIQANANKVNTVVTIPTNPTVGTLGTVTVTGCTGTVGAAKVLYFSPVSASTWPADAFEFVDSDINIQNYPNNNYKDVAKIPTADVLTTDNCYTEIFTFVINGAGSATTTPANFISSGTQVKHTTNDSGSFNVVIPPATCGSFPAIVVTPTTLTDAVVGTPYSVDFNATGGPTGTYNFSSGTLPDGLTLNATTGVVSGTPTTTGNYSFTVTATDTSTDPLGCSGSVTVNLAVLGPDIVITKTDSADPVVVGAAFSWIIEATNIGNADATGVVWNDVLPAGVDFVSTTPSTGCTYTSGTRTVSCTIPSLLANSGNTVSISINVVATAATTLNNTATAVAIGPEPTANNTDSESTVVNCATLTVLPAGPTLTAGQVGVAYSLQFSTSGGSGTYTYALTSGTLPPGVTLSTSGLLSGTPTTVGNYPVTITVSDATGAGCPVIREFTTFNIIPESVALVPTASETALLILLVLLAGAALIRMRA